jgi:hypothetical protein
MSENPLEAIERLEKLAAWHRTNAEHAGADWVWEARLRTAQDLERQAAKIRAQLSSGNSVEVEIAALPGRRGRDAPDDIGNVNRCTRRRIASSAAIPASRLRKLTADATKSRRRSHAKSSHSSGKRAGTEISQCHRN